MAPIVKEFLRKSGTSMPPSSGLGDTPVHKPGSQHNAIMQQASNSVMRAVTTVLSVCLRKSTVHTPTGESDESEGMNDTQTTAVSSCGDYPLAESPWIATCLQAAQ